MKHPLRHLIPALALATLLALPASGVAAAPPLQPYVAHYEVLRDGAPAGRATVSLNAEGEGQWRLHSRTEGTQGLAALAGLLVEETSVFSETAKGLQCISYRYRQSGLRVRERSVDCGSGETDIVSRDHRGEYRFPAQPGVLDRQTVSLALAHALAPGKQTRFEFPVVDRERLEEQVFRMGGEETISLPGGELRAWRVERIRDDDQRHTTTWFDPEQRVPLRVLQREGGRVSFEMRLLDLERGRR
ncbi:DUF3108 domain-containing protein [Denitratimonas sp. CY0512]|uniref:DUF3108 domain-containing protein n=1 Tax=Denitratimonas sp. CY0512 TaxID=3131940 RepID=UPI00309A8B6F